MKTLFTLISLLFICIESTAQPITVVTEHFPPLSYQDGDQVKGKVTNIVRKVLDESNLDYQIQIYPWPRTFKIAHRKPNVLIYSLIRTPERENQFHWIGLADYPDKISFFGLRDNAIKIDNIEQAKEYRVGVIRKDVNHEWLLEHGFSEIHLSTYRDILVKQLFADRIDLLMQNESFLYQDLKDAQRPVSGIKKLLTVKTYLPYIALSIHSSPELADQLRNDYEQLVKSKRIPDFSLCSEIECCDIVCS